VDGLIVTGVNHPELSGELLTLQKNGLPVVTIYNDPLHPHITNIGIPDADLSDAATTHLIESGCTRILHLSVLPSREAGHRAALTRAGLPVEKHLIIPMAGREGFRAATAAAAIRKTLNQGLTFDGVSAQSDAQAFGVINELTRSGINVPRAVKVIGIDNAPFAELCIVPLSSVSQRFLDRGRLAVESLESLIQGTTPSHQGVQPRLHIRASSALQD
jgi:DNA-binding LacI/PurR family transcriptional regulator